MALNILIKLGFEILFWTCCAGLRFTVMGLCKQCHMVTRTFCWTHNHHVCEACMLSTHQTCPIGKYTDWLQDIKLPTGCASPLCSNSDVIKQGGTEVLRFPCCLRIIHKKCFLTSRQQDPDLKSCPSCDQPFFCRSDSPASEILRAVLVQAGSWSIMDFPVIQCIPNASQPNSSHASKRYEQPLIRMKEATVKYGARGGDTYVGLGNLGMGILRVLRNHLKALGLLAVFGIALYVIIKI